MTTEQTPDRANGQASLPMRSKLMSKTKYAVLVGALVAVAGCGADQSREDAKDVGHVDKAPPEVVAFNNHYPNVEMKCDGHGHRLYVLTHDSATGNNLIVIDDPTCPGGASK